MSGKNTQENPSTQAAQATPARRKRLRFDTAPLPVRTLIWLYGYPLAALFFVLGLIGHYGCRIQVSGRENLTPGTNYIFVWWHEQTLTGGGAFLPNFPRNLGVDKLTLMMSPVWYNMPVILFHRWFGIRNFTLGTSGYGGKSAAATLAGHVTDGHSAIIQPDGPYGPTKVFKPGALNISMQTGVAIVPVSFRISRYLRLPIWDRRIYPLPLSRIEARFGRPYHVTEKNFNQAADELARMMG